MREKVYNLDGRVVRFYGIRYSSAKNSNTAISIATPENKYVDYIFPDMRLNYLTQDGSAKIIKTVKLHPIELPGLNILEYHKTGRIVLSLYNSWQNNWQTIYLSDGEWKARDV